MSAGRFSCRSSPPATTSTVSLTVKSGPSTRCTLLLNAPERLDDPTRSVVDLKTR